MAWRNFRQVKVPLENSPSVKPRYSLSGDILAFRRCPRQYGFFAVRGYVPAHSVQLFYGTIIHEVLDRVHKHYEGLENSATKGKIPTDDEIDGYFDEVESALLAKNVRAINRDLSDRARKVLKQFNKIEGPGLYPRVIDTEHRVQGDRETHIVEGVIDVLLDPETRSKDPSQVEIWDYKGSKRPNEKKNRSDIDSYRYQMLVYAWLYKVRNGCYPKRAVLYFLNELARKGVHARPKNALYSIDMDDSEIQTALREFDKTALKIRECKKHNKWNPPKHLPTIADTCTICDIRWSCSSFTKVKSPTMTYP